MESISPSLVLTASAGLAALQVSALTWRIKRELAMEEKEGTTWLTLADYLVGVSFLVLVLGVFASLLFGTATTDVASKLFGVALILFATSWFVLAGHYNLYGEWGKQRPREHRTKQEFAAWGFSLILLLIYIVWWVLA